MLHLKKDTIMQRNPDGSHTLIGQHRQLHLKSLPPALIDVLQRAVHAGVNADDFFQGDFFKGGFLLDQLMGAGFLAESVPGFALLEPIAERYQWQKSKLDTEAVYSLSRFAYLHTENGAMLLESPLSMARIHVQHWRFAALLTLLATPRTIPDLIVALDLPLDQVTACLALLWKGYFITSEAESIPLQQWEFHDLLFHSRSRMGRHQNPIGGVYPFLDRIAPLPAAKPPMSEHVIPLYKPDLNTLADRPLTEIIETRRSMRQFKPITAQQLGEFLYRTVRTREIRETPRGDLVSRPYPAGGALHELEFYLTLRGCPDIQDGFYYYDGVQHQLAHLRDFDAPVQALVQDAARALGQAATLPPVLITFAARFQRMAWKYRTMSYAVMLKHVGVVQQTMYLVATAMQLAPCAIGAGNADLFSEIAQTDYVVEGSVGEFVIGR